MIALSRPLSWVLALTLWLGLSSLARSQVDNKENPDNSAISGCIDSAYRAAQTAARAGDTRGAIVALERVLSLNPNLPNIRLELGILYLKAGSTDIARYHLEAALAAPSIPSAARARAQEALAQARAASGGGTLTGVVSVGARYESNANAGPGSRNVLIFGLPATLDRDSMASAELSFTGAMSATYAHGLGGQRGHLIEADVDMFGSTYVGRSELDFALASLQLGPRFFLGPVNASTLSIRPFVNGSYQTLGGDEYLKTYGGGVNMRTIMGQRLYLAATANYARQNYHDTAQRFLSDRNGDAYSVIADANYLASPQWLLRAGVLFRRDDAKADYQAYDRFGGNLGATFAFPAGNLPGPISIAVLGGYSHSKYDGPDRTIDPRTTRSDDRWEGSLTLAAPMTGRLSLVLSAAYVNNGSTLALYDYDNAIGRMEIQYRF